VTSDAVYAAVIDIIVPVVIDVVHVVFTCTYQLLPVGAASLSADTKIIGVIDCMSAWLTVSLSKE
jgi:hypothetical protein